jgi:S1-C subfamily serine protease
MQVVGSECYVLSVKPRSDAEAKGLQVGDRVLSIDDHPMEDPNANFDPVLARAAEIVGIKLDAKEPESCFLSLGRIDLLHTDEQHVAQP